MNVRYRVITVLVMALALGVAGCPHTRRRTLVPDVPTTGDAGARARFHEARSEFERDGAHNTAEFKAIADEFPDDPIADYALLYAGMSAFDAGEHQTAAENLRAMAERPDVDERIRQRGAVFLGMAEVHLGEYDAAARHLREGERALGGDKERGRFTAYLAEALGHGRDPMAALDYYDRWYTRATAAEKAYIGARLGDIAGRASAEQAARAYREIGDPGRPSAAVLGMRVAADLRARGELERARRIERDIDRTRRDMGLSAPDRGGAEAGDPDSVAAVLPLTGARSRVGEPAMRGLSLAAGTFAAARDRDIEPFSLVIHDSASTRPGARTGVGDSIAGRAIAIVGPIDGDTVDAVAPLAESRHIPLISLNLRSGRHARDASRFVFHMLLPAEDRAESLARHARERGVHSVAMLRPDNGYGRAVSQAFREQFERLDGDVVSDVPYPTGTTSFGNFIARLGSNFDAVFIPDRAARLALIAPALAAAHLEVRPLDSLERERARKRKRRSRTRAIGLLSTAELVTPDYIRRAGRYSEGAVLAPGFYPDREDPLIRDFVERFDIAFASLPTALDAHAYDAARVLRAVVAQGARTRSGVAAALRRAEVEGLTGTIRFGDRHQRVDDGLLFVVVEGPGRGSYAIRAMR